MNRMRTLRHADVYVKMVRGYVHLYTKLGTGIKRRGVDDEKCSKSRRTKPKERKKELIANVIRVLWGYNRL